MCQTRLITQRVVRLSKRSYSHRLEVAMPNGYGLSKLVRLNRDLDNLYELLYAEWRTVTEEDYKIFGDVLVIMLHTLKQLHASCLKLPKKMGLRDEVKKLGMNYSALYELNSDIVNFCIRMPHNQEMKRLMGQLASPVEERRLSFDLPCV